MDNKTKKAVNGVLAAIGTVTMVKTAPVLMAGIAIGGLISNADKIKKVVTDRIKVFEIEFEEATKEHEAEMKEFEEKVSEILYNAAFPKAKTENESSKESNNPNDGTELSSEEEELEIKEQEMDAAFDKYAGRE